MILSIEDHCSLVQQRKMAAIFQDQFGDSLLTAPLDKNETELPSPERLKRRIILKHKKLPPEGVKDETVTRQSTVTSSTSTATAGDTNANDAVHGMDIAHSLASGILYLQDADDLEWKPHFFVLTHNKIFYSEVRSQEDAENEEDEGGAGGGAGGGGAGGMGGGPGAAGSAARTATASGITGTGDQAELHFSEVGF